MTEPFSKILSSTSKRICLIAAPGSGKTKKLLLPKAQLLLDAGILPKGILLLSFSRLGAEDIRKRLGLAGADVRASTVHSYALAFLISENDHAIRNRVGCLVVDNDHKAILISDLDQELHLGRKQLKTDLAKYAAAWGLTPGAPLFEATDAERNFKHAVERWLVRWESALLEEIIHHAVQLAEAVPDAPLIKEPRHILVDEYQDLNALEQAFIEQLASDSDLLIAVGDPDQAIYTFRSAHPEGIRSLSTEDGIEAATWMETLRCPKAVVAIARQLLTQPDPLRPHPENKDGAVRLVRTNTQESEFAFVLGQITALLHLPDVKPEDVLILVPRKEIGKALKAYADKTPPAWPPDARLLVGASVEWTPKEQSALALLTVLRSPDAPFKARIYLSMDDLTHYAAEWDAVLQKYGSPRDALAKATATAFPAKKARIRRLCAAIQKLRDTLSAFATQSPDDLANIIIPKDDAQFVRLRPFLDALPESVRESTVSLSAALLDALDGAPEDEKAVRVMTLRQSKGLDAKHVFIVGCSDGNVPGDPRKDDGPEDKRLEEQKRLLYVGMTRTKETLTISYSRGVPFGHAKKAVTKGIGYQRKKGGKPEVTVGPSRFLTSLSGITWEIIA